MNAAQRGLLALLQRYARSSLMKFYGTAVACMKICARNLTCVAFLSMGCPAQMMGNFSCGSPSNKDCADCGSALRDNVHCALPYGVFICVKCASALADAAAAVAEASASAAAAVESRGGALTAAAGVDDPFSDAARFGTVPEPLVLKSVRGE